VLRRYGTERDIGAGEVLFADGDLTYDLFVVLAGEVRLIERRGQPRETIITTYGPSQFLGEIGLLTGQRAYLSAVAGTAGRVLRVDTDRRQTSVLAVRGLFVFIGVQPATGWLAGQLAEDAHGFLLTGSNITEAQLEDKDRAPLFLETSRPGVFAVGDVRSGSVKRAATAIGEGSMAVRLVFERLTAKEPPP
jgi:pyruvate/2-oxoglutarate dehydrogenase complex dihydrolipoamide dehydrogenase (E3) component